MRNDRSILSWVDAPIPFSLLVRLFLGGYFVYTGIVKALDPVAFLKGIDLYDMLPVEPAILLNATAVVLPWLEIVCGVALILGLWIRGAALNIAIMLLVFTPAILIRGLEIRVAEQISFFAVKFDCGCGTGVEIIWIKLCKNTGLFLLALLAMLSRSRRFALDGWTERRQPAAAYCRRCGQPLTDPSGGTTCESCHDRAHLPAGAPDAAS